MGKKSLYYRRLAVADMVIAAPLDVRLIHIGFVAGEVFAQFQGAYTQSGAVVSFTGSVRPGDGVSALELTHYEPLTLPGMVDLANDARVRWALDGLLVWHRVGVMVPGDPIVLIAAASAHRRSAFQAVDFMMDHLKSAAWLWKREHTAEGWRWIEPREQDLQDRGRWEREHHRS